MTYKSTPIRMIAAMALALGVSACAGAPNDTVTRSAASLDVPQQAAPMALDIRAVRVDVPRKLKVSEANRFYPGGDIVWRGDAIGDRYAQVTAIFDEAAERATNDMDQGLPVVVDIEVKRFHALTEKARYFTGGVHDMIFVVRLSDPETGQPLTEPHQVKASMRALGGSEAIAADQRGETQKVRITDHLSNVIRTEMIAPGTHHAEGLGLMGVLNTL